MNICMNLSQYAVSNKKKETPDLFRSGEIQFGRVQAPIGTKHVTPNKQASDTKGKAEPTSLILL